MTVNGRSLAAIVLLTVAGSIVSARAAGWWITESTRVPTRIAQGEFAGAANPADLRGSYTLADVAASFEVDLTTLATAFGLADLETAAAVRLGDFEELYGELPVVVPAVGERAAEAAVLEVGTDAMRLFVARYLGLPYEPEATTGLPEQAVALLLDRDTLTDGQRADIGARAVALPGAEFIVAGAETEAEADRAAPAAADHEERPEYSVSGNTTFGEMLTWGVTVEAIERALGREMGARPIAIRTWATEEGLQFGALRVQLQAVVDEHVGTAGE